AKMNPTLVLTSTSLSLLASTISFASVAMLVVVSSVFSISLSEEELENVLQGLSVGDVSGSHSFTLNSSSVWTSTSSKGISSQGEGDVASASRRSGGGVTDS